METLIISLGAAAYFVFALARIETAVTGLSLFFPLYLVKGDFGGLPFTFVEALIYATALASVIGWIRESLFSGGRGFLGRFRSFFVGLKDYLAPKESFFHRYRYLLIGVFGFVLAALLSFLVTKTGIPLIDGQIFPGQRVALGILKGWIIAPVIYLLLLLAIVRGSEGVFKALNGYAFSAVILSLWAIFQVVTGHYITPDARASGPFESANYLALFITPALLYLVIKVREMFQGKSRVISIGAFIACVVLFVALIATKSYAAMIALAAAALFYFGAEYRSYCIKRGVKAFSWKLPLLLVIFAGLILFVVFAVDPSKWQAMFQFGQRNSSSVRLEVYSIAWGLIKDNWLFGIGMGQFPALYQVDATAILGHVPYEWNMLHPHNLYLALWLNLGLLGLASFLYLIVVAVKRVWGCLKDFIGEKRGGAGKLRVVLFAMLLIILVHGIFDTPFFKNDLALLFWLILGSIFVQSE
ncbi:O-antigen ligase family protein [Patescibacteria group bacterium]|nr:O-antigen ligase family protein [Patescibacteria group bacterium]